MSRFTLSPLPLLAVALAALLAGPACSDPMQSGAEAEQGKEIEGIPKGPLHRAGQPCVVCHSKNGSASDSIFTIAGTIFQGPEKLIGVANAEVRMTDSLGTKHVTKTNCVGNFMVTPGEWDPKFPILVAVAKGGTLRRMNSVIGREPSCGHCHSINPDRDKQSSLSHIFLFGTEEVGALPVPCEVDPRIR